ncbi:Nn.00g013600.m01.CDS01 [Neocucurbitaria sp. VM-36]
MAGLYRDFDSATEIRLFTILPGDPSSPIRCNLRTVDFQDSHQTYTALSYCWGAPDDKKTIYVKDHPLDVPSNLAALLRQFRGDVHKTTPLTFMWADSICINQVDLDERSREVWKMKAIYENALEVFLWLGPAADDSARAGRLIERLWAVYPALDLDKPIEIMTSVATVLFNPDNWKRNECPDIERDLGALRCLLERNWWRRTWILQEATTRSKTSLASGEWKFGFGESLQAIRLAQIFIAVLTGHDTTKRRVERPHAPPSLTEKFEALLQSAPLTLQSVLVARHILVSTADLSSILNIAHLFRDSEATDDRDKLFAPFSLFGGQNLPGFAIDYNVPMEQVYRDFARSSILATIPPNLDVLGYCLPPEQHQGLKPPSLPSWVPNWATGSGSYRVLPKCLPGSQLSLHSDGPAYAADTPIRRKRAPNEHLRVCPQGDLLHVSGLLLAQLEVIGRFADDVHWEDPKDHPFFKHAKTKSYLPTGTTLYEACVMTMSCGLSHERGILQRSGLLDWRGYDYIVEFRKFLKDRTDDKLRHIDHAFGRRLATTNRGFIALVPSSAQTGDLLYLLYGGQVVYCLRKDGDKHIFLGECYVHGIMDGEALEFLNIDEDKVILEEIIIK